MMQYVCPLCGAATPTDQWRETSVACEDCGDHAAILCPSCEEPVDLVYYDPEEVE